MGDKPTFASMCIGHPKLQTLCEIDDIVDCPACKLEKAEALIKDYVGIEWHSIDKDNMEFEGKITCYQMDRIREHKHG